MDASKGASKSGWLKVLDSDNRLVVTAGAQAEKAADLVLGQKSANPSE